jgi:hypothetical protein
VLLVDDVLVATGQTVSFYVDTHGQHVETNATTGSVGDPLFANTDLTVGVGSALSQTFGGTASTSTFRGTISYGSCM